MSHKKLGGGGGDGGGSFDFSQFAGLIGPMSVIIINPSISTPQSAKVKALAPASVKAKGSASAEPSAKVKDSKAKVKDSKAKVDAQVNDKTVLCPIFKWKGECSYGSICPFAHGTEELIWNLSDKSVGEERDHSKPKPTNYKTVLCTFFKKDGGCSKGIECHFAHGEEELRSLLGEKVQKDSDVSSSSHGEREFAPRFDCTFSYGSGKSSSSHGERELKQSKLSRWMKKK